MNDWYCDGDGDFMPASPDAWDDLADEAQSFYRDVIPGFETMNDNMQEFLIQYVGSESASVAGHRDTV